MTDPSVSLPLSAIREPIVLNELTRNGITWQARRGEDRGRLQVLAVVPPSETPTLVPMHEATQ